MDTAVYLMGRAPVVNKARADGKRLLNNLIRWGQFKPAKWLLSRGARVAIKDERGWAAVEQALSRGDAGMIAAIDKARG